MNERVDHQKRSSDPRKKIMKPKIKVTFDMCFDPGVDCKTKVHFTFTDRPDIAVPDDIKRLVIGEIGRLCGAMEAASKELFSDLL